MKEFVNTLENLYSSIYLVGEDDESKIIADYLLDNSNITFAEVTGLCMDEGNRYTLNREINTDSVILFSGKYTPKSTYDRAGRRLFCWFWDSSDLAGKMRDADVDLNEEILPRLRRSGVKIIRCYAPDMAKISGYSIAKWSMRGWRMIRRFSPSLFGNLRHRIRKTRYLQKEQGG